MIQTLFTWFITVLMLPQTQFPELKINNSSLICLRRIQKVAHLAASKKDEQDNYFI